LTVRDTRSDPMVSRPDEQRILEVYRQTISQLYAYVSRRCGGERPLAEDVVQETWLRAVDAWRRQGVPDAPSAWLVTVARNLLISHYRRYRPLPLGDETPESVLAVMDEGLDTAPAESATLIQWGLARLPRTQSQVLEAFHLEQQPVARIAADLRLSERAVEGRLRRARRKLRQVIERMLAKQGVQR
jgi:RNA polymerase sigma-70 factor (ECF subfamily)